MELEMFQKESRRENQNTHFLFSIFLFSEILLFVR